jgi:hypothetical protein
MARIESCFVLSYIRLLKTMVNLRMVPSEANKRAITRISQVYRVEVKSDWF